MVQGSGMWSETGKEIVVLSVMLIWKVEMVKMM
jgi:hypothetical protein